VTPSVTSYPQIGGGGLAIAEIRYAFFSYGVFFRHRVMDLRE
jgi:hypothetical protein